MNHGQKNLQSDLVDTILSQICIFLLYFSLVQYHEIPAVLSAELYLSTEAYTIASNSRANLARPF